MHVMRIGSSRKSGGGSGDVLTTQANQEQRIADEQDKLECKERAHQPQLERRDPMRHAKKHSAATISNATITVYEHDDDADYGGGNKRARDETNSNDNNKTTKEMT
jgi:hypothetical protein